MPLDNGDPAEALKLFQLGQIAAQDSSSAAALALLHADAGLAYAHLADQRQALAALRRAEDEYAHVDADDNPEFVSFFDRGALDTNVARVLSALGRTNSKHRHDAIIRLDQALTEAPASRVRQRAFNLAWLATCTLAEGDLPNGTRIGADALDVVRDLRSTRILDHLEPLHVQARRHSTSDTDQLAHEIGLLRSAA